MTPAVRQAFTPLVTSYELEIQLDANQDDVTDGKAGIEVTVADPDNPIEGDRLGEGTFLPITVQV